MRTFKKRASFYGVVLSALPLLFLSSLTAQAQTVTVSWGQTYQIIDGFGASDALVANNGGNWENYPMTSATADLLFSQTSGIGLSLLRTEVPDDGSCSSVSLACAGAVSDMSLAIARGARVWSTPWSPPASMKSNGSVMCKTGSEDGTLNSDSYSSYATYLSNYIASLAGQGISLYGLSVQNEPDYCPDGYDGATWSAEGLHEFIKNNLGPTLVANRQAGTLVIMPETSSRSNLAPYGDPTLRDSSAAAYVAIVATHDYMLASGYPSTQSINKHLWETEVATLHTGWNPSMSDALKWAQHINDWMVKASANAWHYWTTINRDNEGLLYTPDRGVTFEEGKRYYVVGNYSKFVRPGCYRIGATPTPRHGVFASAYSNPSTGTFVIVVINQNKSSLSQTFSLNGFGASSVTPWVTSPTLNLAQQPDVAVSRGAFNYTLAAHSVTTFVGVASGILISPTNLSATVE